MGATIFLVWLLLTHMPPVDTLQEFVRNLPEACRANGRDVSLWFQDMVEKTR